MKKILIMAVPVVLVIIVLVAVQSHGFGFGRGHGGHHGMAKDFVMWKMDQFSKELNLNPSQQAKWDALRKDLESRIDSRSGKRSEIHEAVQAELSKENPDLSKLTPLIHGQIDDMSQFGHDLVNRIGELYTDLTPEQKKIVAKKLEEHHSKFED